MHPRARREISSQVAVLGGVARTAALVDLGFRRADFERAIAAGMLHRIRQGWVASPDASPLLVSAAKRGVVLSCVTQARRLGVWVHDHDPGVHVAATPGSAGRKPKSIRVHWSKPLIPRAPGILEDPIENVLAIVAECEPFEQALATWESALHLGLIDREAMTNLPLRPAARRVLRHAQPFADAGTESYLRPRLRWLKLSIRTQIWIAGHRVDALIGDRLVLQIDGGHHIGDQRSEDISHDAELRLMGYHVIRISYDQLMNAWPMVQDLIMRAVAQGLHLVRHSA